MSEQDTTLTDDQIRAESTWEETGGQTEEGDSDGMDTGGGSDSDSADSDSDGMDSDSDGSDS